MLIITMKLDILTSLTPQVTTIIRHHTKQILLKKEKKKERKEIQTNVGHQDQNSYIKNLRKTILR